MRADRAYIAGLGTTGVLVASAVLLLAVVSTLVAFRGWPGSDAAEDTGNLIVGESERALVVRGPARIAREAAPAAGAVAETAAPGTAAAASARAPRTAAGPTRPEGGRRPPVELPPCRRCTPELPEPERPRPPDPPDPPPETPVAAELQRLTSGLGATTQGVTDGLGQTVGTLSPPLGQTLIDTGQVLAELLRALGQPRR